MNIKVGNFIILISILLPLFCGAQLTVSFTFIPDNVCSGEIITFTSTVTGGTGPYNFNWNFGDGFNSTESNPTHIYNAFGCNTSSYNVTLVVTDSNEESDNHSEQVSVKKRPDPVLEDLLNDPDFSNCENNPTPEDPNFTIEIQNATQNTSCITEYSINWGNGDPPLTGLTSNSFPITYTYIQLGAFSLVFAAQSTNGCTGTTVYTVKNQSSPAVGIGSQGATQGCAPITIEFNLYYYDLNSPGTIYGWDFGDGSSITIWTQEDAFANNGIISHKYNSTSCGEEYNQFTATVTTSNSCFATSASVSGIRVWTKPVANFVVDPDTGYINQTCFDFINTTSEGYFGPECTTNTNYFWDFGNGETSTFKNPPCQTYSQTGIHNLTLTTNNACGESSFSRLIHVQNDPLFLDGYENNNLRINIIPNPSSSDFGISINGTSDHKIKIDILNLTGQIIFSRDNIGLENDQFIKPNILNIPRGIYLLNASDGTEIILKKIIIQ